MRGLYDQIVELNRDKTKPPFRCRSCGSEEFKEWEPIWCSNWITVLDYDPDTGFVLDYGDSRTGDGGDFPCEFWCANCADSASSLEELVGLPQPEWAKPRYRWVGWFDGAEDCEPPEPGKFWIEVQDDDFNEIAVVVCREPKFEELKGQKEAQAQMIVDALNAR